LKALDGNPVQDLIDAINKLIVDLHDAQNQSREDFAARTEAHESEVQRLDDLIIDAQNDIANAESFLNNVLYVARE